MVLLLPLSEIQHIVLKVARTLASETLPIVQVVTLGLQLETRHMVLMAVLTLKSEALFMGRMVRPVLK